jgi:hypothetical protein
MPTGRVHGGSAPVGAGQVLGAQTGDRHVFAYVTGSAQVRLGFEEADVTQSGAGFAIPRDGVKFVLAQGDELWANGDSAAWQSRLYLLVTKVA